MTIMKQISTFLGALILGAGAMYYLDPEQGRRRRALVAARVDSMSHDARDYLEGKRKRTADRVRGLFAAVRGRMNSAMPIDEQLNAQIRSRLGRVVSYPHAIETYVTQGRVQLRGAILADEFNPLMAEIWTLRGVTAIDSQLSQHAEPGNAPGLQGRPHRAARVRMRNLRRTATTALAVTAGIGVGLGAIRAQGNRPGMLSLALGLLAWGFNGARHLVPMRFGRSRQTVTERVESRTKRLPETATSVGTPEPAAPSAWH
jgi:hypothetical protein